MSQATLKNSRVDGAAAPEPTMSGIADRDGPVTVSGQEMVRLTGVARERLRTWERRHGFPIPVRTRNNTRRYRVEDVRRVASVGQLSASGVPLVEAIETVLAAGDVAAPVASLGATLDHAPAPALAISGPEPLQVAWVNGTTARSAAAPQIGDPVDAALPSLSDADRQSLRELLLRPDAAPVILTVASWVDRFPTVRRSIAWRTETGDAGDALVVLMELPAMSASPAAESDAAAAIRHQGTVYARAMGEARRELQRAAGLGGIQRAIEVAVEATGAVDGFVALCRGTTLRVASSVRGSVSRGVVDHPCSDIALSLVDGEVDWLSEPTMVALGVGSRRAAVAVPLIAAGDQLGVIVFTFAGEFRIGDAARELLMGFGTTVAATLARERVALSVARPGQRAVPAASAGDALAA